MDKVYTAEKETHNVHTNASINVFFSSLLETLLGTVKKGFYYIYRHIQCVLLTVSAKAKTDQISEEEEITTFKSQAVRYVCN